MGQRAALANCRRLFFILSAFCSGHLRRDACDAGFRAMGVGFRPLAAASRGTAGRGVAATSPRGRRFVSPASPASSRALHASSRPLRLVRLSALCFLSLMKLLCGSISLPSLADFPIVEIHARGCTIIKAPFFPLYLERGLSFTCPLFRHSPISRPPPFRCPLTLAAVRPHPTDPPFAAAPLNSLFTTFWQPSRRRARRAYRSPGPLAAPSPRPQTHLHCSHDRIAVSWPLDVAPRPSASPRPPRAAARCPRTPSNIDCTAVATPSNARLAYLGDAPFVRAVSSFRRAARTAAGLSDNHGRAEGSPLLRGAQSVVSILW